MKTPSPYFFVIAFLTLLTSLSVYQNIITLRQLDRSNNQISTPSGKNKEQNGSTQATTPTTTNNDQDLQTFRSDFGHFSFKLPKNHIGVVAGNCEGLCSRNISIAKIDKIPTYFSTGINIMVTDHQLNQTIDSVNKQEGYSGRELESMEIGGIEAKKYDNSGLYEVTDYRFAKGNFFYSISVESLSHDNKPTADLILSSFTFTQ